MKRLPLAILLAVPLLCAIGALCALSGLCSLAQLRWGQPLLRQHLPVSTPYTDAPHAPSAGLSGPEALLASAQLPPADPYALAQRLRHQPGPVTRATLTPRSAYSIGDHERFWLLDLESPVFSQIDATMQYLSPHLYLWVQDDLEIPPDALRLSAHAFEERLYPTVRRFFGSEWSPGIDNDVRLTILHARFSGATGYFFSGDEYLSAVVPHSNQREMFYINPRQAEPGTEPYDATLAHELQHMVHWHADANEEAWVSEGAAELSMHLCGYPRSARVGAFAGRPDVQLTLWQAEDDGTTRHYAAAFLFLAYYAERFGAEMTRDLIASPLNGPLGFESVLRQHGLDTSFEDLFVDWTTANYLSGADVSVPAAYAYGEIQVRAQPERSVSSFPAEGTGTVHQYAADYIELHSAGTDIRVDFDGAAVSKGSLGQPMVPLVPNQAHSGSRQWWSNRGDNSDMTLTRPFDLRKLSQASLEAWLWYDIEAGWDYAHVEASIDGGESWEILTGRHTTLDNPSGNSYGPGYTGLSGDGPDRAAWVREVFDLSPFTGHNVWIRFEYLTDEAVTRPGLCVDDLRIPEIGYSYDAEASDDGWVAEGFVRTDNALPQRYVVQLIRIADKVSVERVSLDEQQRGTVTLRGFDAGQRAVLVISAVTPVTSEVGNYRYQILPLQ